MTGLDNGTHDAKLLDQLIDGVAMNPMDEAVSVSDAASQPSWLN